MKAPTGKTILFFSRGRGYGHAVPDMAIATEILGARGDVNIRFASYATGASALRDGGWDPVDLNLPERNEFVLTLRRAHALISRLEPSLVVAHEEFAALPAAKICGVQSVFISAWLPPPNGLPAECLAEADGVIVLWEPGTFSPSHPKMPRPHFVGPVGRKLTYSSSDRARARAELNVPLGHTVITVAPGGWAGEQRAPIARVVLGAFDLLGPGTKTLFWLAGPDRVAVESAIGPRPGVRVLGYCDPVERWLVASDVLITKGTRGLSLESARLGLPSISLSPRLNPVDDLLVPQIRSNIPLVAGAVDAETLAGFIQRQLASVRAPGHGMRDGLAATAQLILRHLAGSAPDRSASSLHLTAALD